MLKNYFNAALRSMMKNKIFSSINIAGLAIGMAACLLILQYVSFQLSFDQFNPNAANVYRVYNDRYQNGKLIQHGTITYSAIGEAMQNDFPEITAHSRVAPQGRNIIIFGDKKIGDQQSIAADEQFLHLLSYPLAAGDARTALLEPHSIVLSETCAEKIFGMRGKNYASLLGKLLLVETDSIPFKITGIAKDVPENSHLNFDILIAYSTLYTGPNAWKEARYDFTDSDFWHYAQLKPGTDYKALEAKFPAFSQRHFQGNKISGSDEKFYLQPLSKAHLYSDFEYEIGETGKATVVWGLLAVAILTIVIAWVNYINLSTAKSLERAREVGVRKVVGATKAQLIKQFLTESLIINLIAFVLALGVVLLLQNSFNTLIGRKLSLAYLFAKGLNGYSITAMFIGMLLLGILVSGFYPAFILSSFKPILVLKGKFTSSGKGILLRRILVVGQFAITVALMISSIVVYRQMRFVSSQDLGMNISQVLIIRPPELTQWDSAFIERENSFTAALQQIPHVQGAATSWNTPGGETGRSFNVRRSDQDSTVRFTTRHNGISNGFTRVYGIKLIAGRDFDYTDFNPNFGEVHNIMLNESATRLLGYASPKDAIGKTIIRGRRKWDVIGVINNYHQKSLRFPIEPSVFMPAYSNNSPISVKLDSKEVAATIDAIKEKFNQFFPGNLFTYSFLDERYNRQYADDRLFGKIFAIFSGFAIFIACLGLLGLSLYATIQRTKEIGVRKVLGASVLNIIFLLSKDFIRLVLIAFVIASPLAWLFMHNWLQDFAYRISISWWIFIAAGATSVIIALATISFQAIKAAMTNPVKSLRTE